MEQLERNRTKVKKLPEMVLSVAGLTNFIFVFQSLFHSFIVPIKGATVLENALVHKMGLYPEKYLR